MDNATQLKKLAGEKAAESVTSGMVVGLGHGSTAIWATRRIAERIQSGELKDVVGIPCSKEVEADATALNIPLSTIAQHPAVDLTIDGADEVDPTLNLIKGGGGALLREKIVAQASAREIIVVDGSKLSDALCTSFALPVEVLPFGLESERRYIASLGAQVSQRMKDGVPFVTDQGNHILDCAFPPLANPWELAARLDARAGVMAQGLFLGIASQVIVAGEGGITILEPKGG